jgi:hypothetical protein
MPNIPNNHAAIYFDALSRTQKGETILSLIHATYHVKKDKKYEENPKEEIALRLKYFFNLFRDDIKGSGNGAGTYDGTIEKFDSQYTIGHEVGIWQNRNLDLSPLAQQVAENRKTIREYLDIIFLNYFQPVNNKTVHLLYKIVEYLNINGINILLKEKLRDALEVEIDNENINATCNFLSSTNYFDFDGKELKYVSKLSKNELLKKCNIKYMGDDGYENAKTEIGTDEKYIEYITTDINQDISPFEINNDIKQNQNRIVFGAPGTGKSFKINEDRKEYFANGNYERVTFHPNYSYAQFVGTYKPKPRLRKDKDGKETNEEYISYEFVAGPFLRMWVKAKLNNNKNYLLIVEEINRANVAAVFGDIFQLLDRKEDGNSEYEIATSEELKNYLEVKGILGDDLLMLNIPSNLFIWATMNSADQGVYPVDAAFKRRWNFEYIGINDGSEAVKNFYIDLKPFGKVNWDQFRRDINQNLTNSELNINEDKLIGPFFLNSYELQSSDIDGIIKSKLLMYLFEDVLKHRKGIFFKPEYNSFSKIIEAYDEGKNIFCFNISQEEFEYQNSEIKQEEYSKAAETKE